MDAINIIKAEMEGKKRQLSELAQAGGRGAEEGGPAPKRKYLTKGQARQLEVQLAAAAKVGSGEASTKSPEKGVLSPEKGGMVPAAKRWIPKQEVIQRLRDIFEPITIFGETDEERIVRLRKAELTRPDEEEMGQKNFLAEQKKKEQQKKAQGDSSDEETLTPEEKRAKKMARLEVLKRAEENAKDKSETVRTWIKRMLKEWEIDIGDLPEEHLRTVKGRMEVTTLAQSKSYLKPLFSKLKKKDMEADILEKMFLIVQHCKNREYTKAGDQYILLSIGKAAWPMGVTSVGIHERSAREQINQSNVAHILNDETQRKFIQSLKRLMTYSQNKYPPDLFSQALEPTCIDTHAPSMLAKLGKEQLGGILSTKAAPESW